MKFSKKQLRQAKTQLREFKKAQELKEKEEIENKLNEANEEPKENKPLSEEESRLMAVLSKKGKNIVINKDNIPDRKQKISKKKIIKNSEFKPEPKRKLIFSFEKGDLVSFKSYYDNTILKGIYAGDCSKDSDFCYVVNSSGSQRTFKKFVRKLN